MNVLTCIRPCTLGGALLMSLVVGSALAIETDQVPDEKRSSSGLHLSAQEAVAMKQAHPDNVLFIDIRTRAEAMHLGMPTLVDDLMPVLNFPAEWEWSESLGEYLQQGNSHFVHDIENCVQQAGMTKDDAVILICRSVMRSSSEPGLLVCYGFKKSFTAVDGYVGDKVASGPEKGRRTVNGWKNAKLPWSGKLECRKVYTDPL